MHGVWDGVPRRTNIKSTGRTSVKKFVYTTIFLYLVLTKAVYADLAFDRMCVFGDSLSDAGIVFEITHTVANRPYDLIPNAPYPIGGMTFSNGKTWIQQLAKSLKMQKGAKPAFRNRGTFCNYAFGGARAGGVSPFDLTEQVITYQGDFGMTSSDGTLFVVLIGGNDIRDAIEAFPADPTPIFTDAINAVSFSVIELYRSGARQFLIHNAPNLALVPAIIL